MAKTMEKAEPRASARDSASSSSKETSVKDAGKDAKDGAAKGFPPKAPQPQPQVPRDPARDSALSRAVQQIEKQFGKGAVMKLDGNNISPMEGIPTGSLSLDIALGGVGVPRGRVLEIFGPESSGKTTLCLHIVASAQKLGGVAAFIDAEHALDPS